MAIDSPCGKLVESPTAYSTNVLASRSRSGATGSASSSANIGRRGAPDSVATALSEACCCGDLDCAGDDDEPLSEVAPTLVRAVPQPMASTPTTSALPSTTHTRMASMHLRLAVSRGSCRRLRALAYRHERAFRGTPAGRLHPRHLGAFTHAGTRGSPAQWLVREPPRDRATRRAFGAPALTPLIRAEGQAGQQRTVGFEAPAGHHEVELVESAKRGRETSTSTPRDRHASARYTLRLGRAPESPRSVQLRGRFPTLHFLALCRVLRFLDYAWAAGLVSAESRVNGPKG